MLNKSIRHFLLLTVFALYLSACDTDDPFTIPPPDFTTVPEAFDTTGVESQSITDGVTIYVHEEGSGNFFVTSRDELLAFITLRTDEGELIFSSFANGRQAPITIAMVNAGNIQNTFQFSVLLAYTPGLKEGLLGMKEGEVRTIVVEPQKGYGTAPAGNPNEEFRDNTLIYDVRISTINPG